MYFGHIWTPNPSTSGQFTIAIAGHYAVALTINYLCNNITDKQNVVIMLEDYHLVSSEFNRKFSEDLKHFIDEEILFVIIGIPSSPGRAFKNNPDLAGRSEIINFDYLSYEEVGEIIKKGEECLNVKFPHRIIEDIHKHSMSNAFLVQAICHQILKQLNITETRLSTFYDFPDKIVEEACKSLANGTLNTEYSPLIDIILGGSRSQQEGKAYNQYEELIKAIKHFSIERIERGLSYTDIGKVAWDSLSPEVIDKYIENGTYKSEATFKTSLNNQISVAMDKIGSNFQKKSAREILIVSEKKLYLMDIIFKFYLNWKSGLMLDN